MRYHISWAFFGYISDLEVTVPFYSVYPVGEGDGRYRLVPYSYPSPSPPT
jgi:hypothetical protein